MSPSLSCLSAECAIDKVTLNYFYAYKMGTFCSTWVDKDVASEHVECR